MLSNKKSMSGGGYSRQSGRSSRVRRGKRSAGRVRKGTRSAGRVRRGTSSRVRRGRRRYRLRRRQ